MALQESGAISLGDIQTEFGGTNPISISEYYGADTGVPGSGTLSLSDFYGTSDVDITPDPVDWIDLGPGTGASNVQTFTGISQAITVRLSPDITQGTLQYRVNGGSYTSFSSNTDISISNNDTLQFNFIDTAQSGSLGVNGTLSITNISAGPVALDEIFVSTYGSEI
jgi:hypothetical protein